MTTERPELRIIDRDLWQEVQARLKSVKDRYTNGAQGMRGELIFKRAPYLLSSILVCRSCGAPMSMMGGIRYRSSLARARTERSSPRARSCR